MMIQTQTMLECEGALSDLVLQAARKAIPADANKLLIHPYVGEHNQPLLPLLVALIESTKTTADAMADNAWDSGVALPKDMVLGLIADLRAAMQSLSHAADAF
jgi:hypothetical protein